MKKTLLVWLWLLTSLSVHSQWVTIPDANFVNFLTLNYPSCMNGNQMDTTCSGIVNATNVNCSNKSISDLAGIEYFDNLNTLNCKNNNLTLLSLLPPSLSYLECSANQIIDIGITLSGMSTFITGYWNK